MSLGLTISKIKPVLTAGGDTAEKQFMECCWCLWKADGVELVEPFVEATFNSLPDKSRSVLFQRMLTIVYVAQDSSRARLDPADDKRSTRKSTVRKRRNGKPSGRKPRKA
jgi:transposase